VYFNPFYIEILIYFAGNSGFVEMSMNQIRLYDLFRRELHLSDDKAAEAVYAVQEMEESAITSKKDALATKEDINTLKKDIQDTKDIFTGLSVCRVFCSSSP
jgi:hypothetical protein